MIIGIGNDLFEVSRLEDKLRGDPEALREQIFTSKEIAYCETKHYPARHLAARFAAKEALFKALAITGQGTFVWREVEVTNDESGRPRIELHGSLKARAQQLDVHRILLTLSHTNRLAAANVILES